MQFYTQSAFFLLWIVAAVALIYFYAKRKRKSTLKKLLDFKLLEQLSPTFNRRALLRRYILLSIAIIFFVFALARPQWGEEQKTVQRKGIDVVFLLDTSLSMLTEDVKPNRITKARLLIDTFLKKLKGDRVGLVTFAGSAFLQSPLTLDYSAFKLFLDASGVGIIPEQGTDLKEALHIAINAFPGKSKKHKAIIVLSDGEDHQKNTAKIAKYAKKEGIKVYAIGIGTKQGAPIPLRAEKGKVSGYKRDSSGEIVISRLHDKVLKEVAKAGGGAYYIATPTEQEVNLILRNLQSMGKRELKEQRIALKEEKFQIFILLGLLCLILEDLVRSSIRRRHMPNGAVLAILCLLWLSQSGFSLDSLADSTKKGNNLYKDQKYTEALEAYRKERVKNPDNPELQYNIGSALYKTKNFQESKYQLDSVAKKAKEKPLQSKTYYNLGNAQYRLGNIDQAIKHYEKAIELNPNDIDAKFNYELLKKKKEEQQKKEDQKKDKQQEKKDQQKKQDKKDQKKDQQKQDQKQKQDEQQKKEKQKQEQQKQEQQKQEQQKQQQQDQQKQKQDQQDQQQQQQQDQQKQQEQQKSDKDEKQEQEDGRQTKDKDQQDKEGESKSEQERKEKEDQKKKEEEQKGKEGEEEEQQKEKGAEEEKPTPKDKGEEEEKEKPEDKGEEEEEERGEEEKEEKPEEKPGEEEKKQPEGEGEEEEKKQPEPQYPGEEPEPQPMPLDYGAQPAPGEEDEGKQPAPQAAPSRKFFDGTMSEREAMKILNTLQNEERQLLHLRRPPQKIKPQQKILKDW